MSDNSLSVEERALAEYNIYWEKVEPCVGHDNRWNKLQEAIYDKDTLVVNEMLRDACVEMFKAGFMLRLTGE